MSDEVGTGAERGDEALLHGAVQMRRTGDPDLRQRGELLGRRALEIDLAEADAATR